MSGIANMAYVALKHQNSHFAHLAARIAVYIPGLVSEEYARSIPRGIIVPKSKIDDINRIFRNTKSCRYFDDTHAGTKASVGTVRKKWKGHPAKMLKMSDTTYAIILNPAAKIHSRFYILDLVAE